MDTNDELKIHSLLFEWIYVQILLTLWTVCNDEWRQRRQVKSHLNECRALTDRNQMIRYTKPLTKVYYGNTYGRWLKEGERQTGRQRIVWAAVPAAGLKTGFCYSFLSTVTSNKEKNSEQRESLRRENRRDWDDNASVFHPPVHGLHIVLGGGTSLWHSLGHSLRCGIWQDCRVCHTQMVLWFCESKEKSHIDSI